MSRIAFYPVITAGLLCAAPYAESKPVKKGDESSPSEYQIDFAPFGKAPDTLDCKISFTCQTAEGEKFQRGLTIKGPVTPNTAEDAAGLLKALLEAHGWDVKVADKTKLLILGKKGSLVAKMEIRVDGLAQKYHPAIERREPTGKGR
jgi:hypothetical protein